MFLVTRMEGSDHKQAISELALEDTQKLVERIAGMPLQWTQQREGGKYWGYPTDQWVMVLWTIKPIPVITLQDTSALEDEPIEQHV